MNMNNWEQGFNWQRCYGLKEKKNEDEEAAE